MICTICARGGSKGVVAKNIREIAGKPLIAHTIETARQTELFEHIVISTDSDEIAEISTRWGGEVFFKRPVELATDQAAKLPVIRHAFMECEKKFGKTYPVHVDLDATSPLRLPEDIVEAVNFQKKQNYKIVLTGCEARRSPYFNLVEKNKEGRIVVSKQVDPPYIRRQDAPPCYDLNASIYIWERETLLNEDRFFLPETGLYEMPPERSIDIDSEADFEYVEFLLNRRRENRES